MSYTIGEVLNLIKEDFEDITISKIRFLESEGLIYPDRTESGYRKFSEDDVDRLRFILTAQREHYLPLKVIRDQLDRLDAGDIPVRGSEQFAGTSAAGSSGQAAAAPGARGPSLPPPADVRLEAEQQPATLGVRELCEATGLDSGEVKELSDYGLIGERRGDADAATFDADDLITARAARELLRLGLEPRHLRMYRNFVDRELALFEQMVTPLLRQRNPEARRQASRQLEQLAGLTGQMKQALLTSGLRGYVHGA